MSFCLFNAHEALLIHSKQLKTALYFNFAIAKALLIELLVSFLDSTLRTRRFILHSQIKVSLDFEI